MIRDTRTCPVDPSGAMHRLPRFKHAFVCALVHSGLYYMRYTFLIKCEGCGQEIDIFTIKEHHSIKIYHKELCPYNKSWNSNSSDCFGNGNELGDEADSITNSKTDSSLSQSLTSASVKVIQVGASKLLNATGIWTIRIWSLGLWSRVFLPGAVSESHLGNNDVRKVLMYAADTCPRSSGAPVIAFQRKTFSDGSQKQDLDIWMHNGVDATNNLGASVMKVSLRACVLRPPEDLSLRPLAYTKDDFDWDSVAPYSSSTNQTHQENDSDDDGTRNLEGTSPVFKVLTHPSYPVYIAYQERLESFVNWEYGNIHTPSSLALAGFFYAGYSDCVRCFQCGLGLRLWKPGDDIHERHRQHRPSCPFLKLRTKLGQDHVQRHGGENPVTMNESLNDEPKSLVLRLLQAENEKLKKLVTSNVLSSPPIRDLFLPCGELYTCGPLQKRSALKSQPRRHRSTVWFGGMTKTRYKQFNL